jgi:hypothetical protein
VYGRRGRDNAAGEWIGASTPAQIWCAAAERLGGGRIMAASEEEKKREGCIRQLLCRALRKAQMNQGFFSRSSFFTGGHRKNRLPRNLKNTADLPNEFFQTNFEFKFFNSKTNRVCILFVTCFWLGGVVVTSRTHATLRGIELHGKHRCSFPNFLKELD